MADPSQLLLTRPEELNSNHRVAGFACGRASLDDWLKNRALKSNAAGDSKVFVVRDDDGNVAGYYAISAGSVSRKEATRKIRKNAPESVPMALIGRLAVRENMQKQGVGAALLRDAILRIAQAAEHLGIKGIVVHALDDDAVRFYAKYGFRPSKIDERHLMISMSELKAELSLPPNA